GMVLDAIHRIAPSRDTTAAHPLIGAKKGAVYSGTFMAIIYGLALLWDRPVVRSLAAAAPLIFALVGGALALPLLKTIIETFDGSHAFFRRVGRSYLRPILYFRGAVAGLGFGYGLTHALADQEIARRVWFGLVIGVAAFAGVNLVRDGIGTLRGW